MQQDTSEKIIWETEGKIAPPDRSKPYKSCVFLEGGSLLFFLDTRILICCAACDGKDMPSYGITLDDEFSLEKMLAARKKIITQNQSGIYEKCEKCPWLIEKKWDPTRYLFDRISFAHFTSCNLQCSYCSLNKSETIPVGKYSDKVLDIISDLLAKNYISPDSEISFSGGEPTLMPQLDEFIRIFTDYSHKFNYVIFTNGTIYSPALGNLIKNEDAKLLISVDAGFSGTYEKIKTKNFFGKVWKNIQRYTSVNPDAVFVKMIIIADNYKEIVPFMETAKAHGVKIVFYDIDPSKPVTEELIDASALFIHEAKKRDMAPIPSRAGLTAVRDCDLIQKIESRYTQEYVEKKEPSGNNFYRTIITNYYKLLSKLKKH